MMSPLALSQMQFAMTSTYHFFFVPLTLGLGLIVAILETIAYRTKNQNYLEMAAFWSRLWVINFAIGVATGIVMEFQFGMNWSEYSRFVGDIFGIPLAIEALMAFFLESTFLGLYLFGRNKLPKAIHLATVWLTVGGATISSLWILVANSWMQEPVGYVLRNGRAEMTDFFAAVLSPHVWVQFPHVVFGAWAAGGFLVMGISAWHVLRQHRLELFVPSLKVGLTVGLLASFAIATSGHEQAQHTAKSQPMKLAAMEALWETEKPASFSFFSVIDQENRSSSREVKFPGLLSLLANNNLTGEVKGLNDLQREAEAKYGAGDYLPPVALTYWSFRAMVGIGMLMILTGLVGMFLWWRGQLERSKWYLNTLRLVMLAPIGAIATGWAVTEFGRQPWIVQGLMKTADAVSPNLTATDVLITVVGFGLLYTVLIVANVYLMRKYALMGTDGRQAPAAVHDLGGVHVY
ncbi:MAG: cytochrome ubiquinol oxidase subunit I [Deinococcales bacterium]